MTRSECHTLPCLSSGCAYTHPVRFIEITPANRHWLSRISAGKEARSWVYRNSYWERNAAEHPEIALRLIMVDEHKDPVGIIAFGQHFADEDLSVPRPGVGEIIHLVKIGRAHV